MCIRDRYLVSQFAYQISVTALDGDNSKPANISVFAVRLTWYILVLIFLTAAKWGTRHADGIGSARRGFRANFVILFDATILMVDAWAFKDVVASILAFVDAPHDSATYTTPTSQRITYMLFSFGVSIGSWVYGVLSCILCIVILRKDWRCGCGGYLTFIAATFFEEMPWSLGIGLAWNEFQYKATVKSFSWYPVTWDTDDWQVKKFRYQAAVTLSTWLATWASLKALTWYDSTPDSKLGWRDMDGGWKHIPKLSLRVLMKSLPYNLAWWWSDALESWFYLVWFNCYSPYNDCDDDQTVFLNVAYALAMMSMAMLAVPALKADVAMLHSLDGFFASELMPEDQDVMRSDALYSDLLTRMLGIMVGWSWINFCAGLCNTQTLPNCPNSIDGETFTLALLTVLTCELLLVIAYHAFIESHRMHERAFKVHAISEGNHARFFDGVDADGDGVVTLEELQTHVQSHGLSKEPFITAYKRFAKAGYEGSLEGGSCVSCADVVNCFTDFMKELEQQQALEAEQQDKGQELASSPKSRNDMIGSQAGGLFSGMFGSGAPTMGDVPMGDNLNSKSSQDDQGTNSVRIRRVNGTADHVDLKSDRRQKELLYRQTMRRFGSDMAARENEDPWTAQEDLLLVEALQHFSATMAAHERWEGIAGEVPGRSVKECAARFRQMRKERKKERRLSSSGVDPSPSPTSSTIVSTVDV
eukprot:TRINITY_DN2800_c0_g1_i1.p1 TRINITY_DN2800_c0_g1~~TRINITY_DN2800_c0_g1_i1.p1  ORF type:complete len:701 (+),score=181.88 TRINITY_DN2800_c0_g1_i1:191-2293(+)